MPSRGSLAIFAIFAIAAAASLSAIAYLRHQSRRATEYWGTEGSDLILNAPQVMLGRVERSKAFDDDGSPETWSIVGERDVTLARGFINVRRGLMIDASFDWEQPHTSEPVEWEYALSFHSSANDSALQPFVILFAPQRRLVAKLVKNKSPRPVDAGPINEGLIQFFAEQSLQ